MTVNTQVLEWTETDLGVAGELREVVRAPAPVLSAVGETAYRVWPCLARPCSSSASATWRPSVELCA